MKLLPPILILVVGVVLLIYAVSANDSAASHVSNLFNGKPTDRTIWLAIGGVLCAAVGLGGIFRARAIDRA